MQTEALTHYSPFLNRDMHMMMGRYMYTAKLRTFQVVEEFIRFVQG